MVDHPPTTPNQPAARRHLQPADLRRLRHLLFSSRRAVEGRFAGRHRSKQHGRSVAFTDYREYTPGESLADLDWKVFGRSDRLFVRIFEHQSDMTVHLVLDASASMDYPRDAGQAHARKFDHACRLAAAIAFLTTRQQDAVGLVIARQGLPQMIRPASSFSHLNAILDAMEQLTPGGTAHLAEALSGLAGIASRRSLALVFSDLLEDREPILHALAAFTHRGGEAVLFHVMHADELELPDLQDAVFLDSETSHRVRLNVPDIRQAYRRRVREFLAGWQSACRVRGMDYNLVSTATPYEKVLERYLFGRASLMR